MEDEQQKLPLEKPESTLSNLPPPRAPGDPIPPYKTVRPKRRKKPK